MAIAGPRDAPRIVAKDRVEMASTFETGAVYHAAQRLPLAEAVALVRSSGQAFVSTACGKISGIAAALREMGLEAVASNVVGGGARPLPPLEAILRSHALVHAAEGELYRSVILRASEACGIPAAPVAPPDLAARVAGAARMPEARVASILEEIGRASGRPWTRDQKEAALAGWLALADRR